MNTNSNLLSAESVRHSRLDRESSTSHSRLRLRESSTPNQPLLFSGSIQNIINSRVIHLLVLIIITVYFSSLQATRYAGELFNLSPGVSNQAMGNTGLTNPAGLSAAWWNPALLAIQQDPGVELSYSQHFEGLLVQNQISVLLGKKARNAIIINHIGIDDIKLTRLENENDPVLSNDNRPIVWKKVANNDLVLLAGFARELKPRLYLGLAPKLVYRSLAENDGYGFGADLGMLWYSPQGLSLAANVRDFFSTQIFWENGTHETVYPALDLETGYRFHPIGKSRPVELFLRSHILSEDREEAASSSFGIFSVDYHAGLGLTVIPQLKVMAGYDIDTITAGLGLALGRIKLDYAYKAAPEDGLGSSQRMSLGFNW